MFNKNLVLIALASATLYGCSSKDPAAVAAEVTQGMNIPQNIEMIQDTPASSANLASVNAAFDDTGTDYNNFVGDVFLDSGAWEDPLTTADFLICVLNGVGFSEVPNGTYKSLVNMTQCEPNMQGGDQKAKVTRFAEAIAVTSRTSNAANQAATIYFLDAQNGRGSDGVLSEAEDMKFVTTASMSEEASAANPFGAFDFNWNRVDAVIDGSTGDYDRGSMSFTSASATEFGFSFFEQRREASDSDNPVSSMWARGLGAKNGDSGKVFVSVTEAGSTTTYRANFNSTHANIISDGTTVCSNLDDDTMTEYVYSYNLYNATTGALIDIAAGVEIVHGTGKAQRGYVGSYWYEGDGTNSEIRLWMHTDDGTAPETVYSKSDLDTAISVTRNVSGRVTALSGMTFVAPIQFTALHAGTAPTIGSNASDRDFDLVYEGAGQLWGIPWANGGSGPWFPTYNLTDGLILTGANGAYAGVEYRVKRAGSWKTLATAAGQCGSLPLTDAAFPEATLRTAPTLTPVTQTWSDKPTVSASPKVIHGKKQF